MASDLVAFVRYLGHSHIVIKSIVIGQNGAQEVHFKAIDVNRAEDYITLRNGKRQLWINLQKITQEVGEYISFRDIESYKNVYIDLDCEKPEGMKDYAATEEERAKALSQLPILQTWLESHGFNRGLELFTGNGAGRVLPIPETRAEPVFIAKLATFLKILQAEISNVDVAMFDPPRVVGIPGTINAKLETEDRENQLREIIGEMPERIEDLKLLSFIQSLEPDPVALKEWSKKYSEPQASPEADRNTIDAGDILDRLTAILETDSKLKSLLDGHIDAYGKDRSRAEYGACGKLIKYGFTDSEIDYIMVHVSKIGKWQEEGDNYRFDQTLRKLREAEETPTIRELKKDDRKGTVGTNPVSGTVCKVVEFEDGDDGKKTKGFDWVSDCAVHIHTETRAKDDTEFIFTGIGAIDKRAVRFTLPASLCAEPRKFKAALINAFGAKNKVGKINFEIVQKISLNIKIMQRVETPAWRENIPLLPGVNLARNVEYHLSSKIPAAVYDGDLNKAKDALRTLLKVHTFAPILVTSILGSPAIARWHKNDRLGLGLWGSTGTLKTTTALVAMGFYGLGYMDAPKLKAGKAGSTTVGAMEVFAAAGFLPQIYDDVKTVDSKDAQSYVATMHGILEGEEKARGKKDGGLRESREFACIPVVTGEVRPQEASTTARVLNMNWTRSNDKLLSDVQANASLLPVIGYHWLRFLADTNFVLGKDFEAYRTKKMEEFLDLRYVNAGRLATINTLLMSMWDLLEASPLGDVFKEARESFKTALKIVTDAQGEAVGEETEISRFMRGLEELLVANPGLIMSKDGKKTIVGSIIGKRTDLGLFLLPTQTMNELTKIRSFNQQPTIDSITQALNEKGILIRGEDRLMTRLRIGGDRVYGWLIKWTASERDGVSPPAEDGKNDNVGSIVPSVPDVLHENERKNFLDEKSKNSPKNPPEKNLTKNSGDSEDNEDREREKREIDSDLDSKVSVPSNVPSDKEDGDKVRTRFKTEYQTDIDGKMRQFHEGDLIEVSSVRAEAWQRRGVVEIVEAAA